MLNTGVGTTVVFNGYAQKQFGMSEAQTGLVTVPYVFMAIAMIRLGEKAIQNMAVKYVNCRATISSNWYHSN